MISFKTLGQYGRLGNQLYQYAFLRTTAQRLGVKFFCPEWRGDKIFLLNDEQERSRVPAPMKTLYRQPLEDCGFCDSPLHIEDGTEIIGFFQAERYFDRGKVTRWYTFRPESVRAAQESYRHIDLAQCTGIHLRFGDMKANPNYVVLSPRYYARALSRVRHRQHVLVFSDDTDAARKHLRGVREFSLRGRERGLRGTVPDDPVPRLRLLDVDVQLVGRLAQRAAGQDRDRSPGGHPTRQCHAVSGFLLPGLDPARHHAVHRGRLPILHVAAAMAATTATGPRAGPAGKSPQPGEVRETCARDIAAAMARRLSFLGPP